MKAWGSQKNSYFHAVLANVAIALEELQLINTTNNI